MTRLWTIMQSDHDGVWALLEELTGGAGFPAGSPGRHRAVARRLVALESAHEVAEETVVWPAVRRACPDGEDLVAEVLSQERDAKWALNELSSIKAGTQEFHECVDTVAGLARTHLSYEQNQVWPRLDDQLDDLELDRLAERWATVRAKAPTRPHPHMPPNPGTLSAAGTVFAPIDRLRDRAAGRRTQVHGARR